MLDGSRKRAPSVIHTFIVTSVLWFCVCLVVLCVLTDFPFGHDQRMLVHVCLVADSVLSKSLSVALDTDLNGT